MLVPVSAANSLRRLRHKDKKRSLWIDAMCIKQEDANELSRQVAVRRRTYSKARMNLILLGQADHDTAVRAVRSVQALVEQICAETAGIKDLRSVLLKDGALVCMQGPVRAGIDIDALAAMLSS